MVIPCVSVYGWALMSPEMVLYVNSYIMQFYQKTYTIVQHKDIWKVIKIMYTGPRILHRTRIILYGTGESCHGTLCIVCTASYLCTVYLSSYFGMWCSSSYLCTVYLSSYFDMWCSSSYLCTVYLSSYFGMWCSSSYLCTVCSSFYVYSVRSSSYLVIVCLLSYLGCEEI
jgi:hypothetical protein